MSKLLPLKHLDMGSDAGGISQKTQLTSPIISLLRREVIISLLRREIIGSKSRRFK